MTPSADMVGLADRLEGVSSWISNVDPAHEKAKGVLSVGISELDAIATELRALAGAEGGGWRSMEDAPRDGTRVILAWGGKSINGFYLDNTWARIPYAGWRVEAMVAAPKGQPDAWQPLPPPPGSGRGGATQDQPI